MLTSLYNMGSMIVDIKVMKDDGCENRELVKEIKTDLFYLTSKEFMHIEQELSLCHVLNKEIDYFNFKYDLGSNTSIIEIEVLI